MKHISNFAMLSFSLCFLVFLTSLNGLEGATYVVHQPVGSFWYLKPTGKFNYTDGLARCQYMKGSVIAILTKDIQNDLDAFLASKPSQSWEDMSEIWTNAQKVKGKYYWHGDEKFPIDPKVVTFDGETLCDTDCCNVQYSLLNQNLKQIPCEAPIDAHLLCFINPKHQLREAARTLEAKLKENESNLTTLNDRLLKLTASDQSQRDDIASLTKSRTTLLVLFGVSFVAVLALGIFIFVIWRRG